MSLTRPVIAVAVALIAAVPSTAAAQSPAPATVELSAAGKRALKPSKVTFSSGKLSVSKATVGASATLELKGSLRFKSGKRSVSATGLKLTVGRTASYVSARVAKKNLRLLTVTPTRPATLDAERGAVALTGARIALTKPGAKALRTALKLKRTPSTKTLGTFGVTVAGTVAPPATATPVPTPIAVPAPNPAPVVTATPVPSATPTATPTVTATPTATPSVTATPGPSLTCEQRVGATPAGVVDWFGCPLPGSGDLKSWTGYVQRDFGGFPCQGPLGTIVAGGGASQVVAGDVLDHRFPVLSTTQGTDGSTTIALGGTVNYRMPHHGIDELIGPMRIVIAPGGLTGTVVADGHTKPIDMSPGGCAKPVDPYTAQTVLTLDFSGITPVTADGVQRWVKVPAKISAGHSLIGGGSYPAGSDWGFFTIALPVR